MPDRGLPAPGFNLPYGVSPNDPHIVGYPDPLACECGCDAEEHKYSTGHLGACGACDCAEYAEAEPPEPDEFDGRDWDSEPGGADDC